MVRRVCPEPPSSTFAASVTRSLVEQPPHAAVSPLCCVDLSELLDVGSSWKNSW